jgi:hypothetical protein
LQQLARGRLSCKLVVCSVLQQSVLLDLQLVVNAWAALHLENGQSCSRLLSRSLFCMHCKRISCETMFWLLLWQWLRLLLATRISSNVAGPEAASSI